MYQILCFSPTGNTKFLATRLAELLNCEIIGVNDLVNCEHLIIMSSIHAFRVPSFLKKKINNIKSISFINVGCNTSFINEASGNHLLKYANKKKIDVITYKVLAMPLNIVKPFDYKYGKKIINDSLLEIESIANNILNNKKDIISISFKSKLFSNIHFIESFFVRLFGLELYANKFCIKCGKCVKVCPKNNIVIKNKVKFKLKCMLCMACIYRCPKKAIHPRFSKFIEIKDYDLNNYLK